MNRTDIASQHDIVINAGSGFHPPSAAALVRGLAKRPLSHHKQKPAWMLHTSGCSNICDRPLTGASRPDAEYSDADAGAVYDFEKAAEALDPYPQRTSELLALDTGAASASATTTGVVRVRVLSVQAAAIFGTGSGLFQRAGLMIPIMMRYVLARGHGFRLGDGSAVIDYVHVADLADLYVLFVRRIMADGGKDMPSGREGIVFPTAGRVLISDIARGCVDAAFARGVLPRPDTAQQPEVREIGLAEAATTTAGNVVVAEVGWAGHRRTVGTVARRLGWEPKHGAEAWKKDFDDELEWALQGKRGITIDNCIAEKNVEVKE